MLDTVKQKARSTKEFIVRHKTALAVGGTAAAALYLHRRALDANDLQGEYALVPESENDTPDEN